MRLLVLPLLPAGPAAQPLPPGRSLGSRTWTGRDPAEGALGSVWFLCNRYTPYPNLYPDQSPSEDWTMEERFRPLTFHGLILRSQLVTLLVRGVCYSESQSVSLHSCPHCDSGRLGVAGTIPASTVEQCVWSHSPAQAGSLGGTPGGCDVPSGASPLRLCP